MKELGTRIISGAIYITLLIVSLYWQNALTILLFAFGLLCMIEFNKLIQLKSSIPYIIFAILYLGFGYWPKLLNSSSGFKESMQILHVITIFVQLLLIKDLFSEKTIPLFGSKRFIITTFYLSSAFVFLNYIANFNNNFTPWLLLGAFILVWVNDTFAYLIGTSFGKQKLFPRISPKKTVEGFLIVD